MELKCEGHCELCKGSIREVLVWLIYSSNPEKLNLCENGIEADENRGYVLTGINELPV